MTEFKALGAIDDQLDRIGTRNQLYYKFNYRQTFSHTDAKKYTTTTRAHPNQVHPRAVSRHAITIPTRAITLQQDQPQYLHQKHFLTFGKIFENKDPNFFFWKICKKFLLLHLRVVFCVVWSFTLSLLLLSDINYKKLNFPANLKQINPKIFLENFQKNTLL
jgi:hypothetical protein